MITKMTPPPLVRWVNYQSTDENNPDVLELKVIGTETTTTEKGIDVAVFVKSGKEWKESMLRLKWHNSRNASLLQQWIRNVEKGKLRSGRRFRLLTWMGITKKTNRPIRKFQIEF